jgi:cytochrome oxidase assembly protein ShyY1
LHYIDKQKEILKNILWIGFTLVVFSILIKLSIWQYHRGFDKEQRTEKILQLNQQAPLTLDEVITLSAQHQFNDKDSINDFPVKITGNFDGDKIFLLDNQVEQGSLGYRVLQILNTSDYSVLVNLGWVQGSINRDVLPDTIDIEGQHTFNGHVRIIEKGIVLTEQDFSTYSWPLRVQQIEIEKFSTLAKVTLLPFVIYLDKNESLGYKKNWHPIVMPAEKHFGYAFQWAALAIAWLILMICLRFKNSSKHQQKTCLLNEPQCDSQSDEHKKKAVKYG